MSRGTGIILCLCACLVAGGFARPSTVLGDISIQQVWISQTGDTGPWTLVADDQGTTPGYVQVLPGDVLNVKVVVGWSGYLPPMTWGLTRIQVEGVKNCLENEEVHDADETSATEIFEVTVPEDACYDLEFEVRAYGDQANCTGVLHSIDTEVLPGVIVVGPQTPTAQCVPDWSIDGTLDQPDALGVPNKQLTITKEEVFVDGDPHCGCDPVYVVKVERQVGGEWVEPARFTCDDIGPQWLRLTVSDCMDGYFDESLPGGGEHWWTNFGYCWTWVEIKDMAAPEICAPEPSPGIPYYTLPVSAGVCTATLPDFAGLLDVVCCPTPDPNDCTMMKFNDFANLSDNCTDDAYLAAHITQFPLPGKVYPPVDPNAPEWPDCPNNWPAQLITLTVTDEEGNETPWTFLMDFADDQLPTINCPASIDITQTDPGDCREYVTFPAPTASDNCCVDSYDHDQLHFDLFCMDVPRGAAEVCLEKVEVGAAFFYRGYFPVGTTVITWTVWDCCGNETSCTQSVRIRDMEDPEIECPDPADPNWPLTVEAEYGYCGADVSVPLPEVEDNCQVATLVNDYNDEADASDWYDVGVTTVTWTVTDADGRTATCSVDITVLDAQRPSLGLCELVPIIAFEAIVQTDGTGDTLCPAALVLQLIDPFQSVLNQPFATRGDNCDIARIYPIDDYDWNDGDPIVVEHTDCFPLGETTIAFVAEDAAGNISLPCTLTFFVIQGAAPPTPTGACCFGTICVELPGWQCNAVHGDYQGDGVLCSSNPCPTPAPIVQPVTGGTDSGTQVPPKLDKESDGSSETPDTGNANNNNNNSTTKPPAVFSLCGAWASVATTLMLVGLLGLRISRRRR